MSVSKIPLKKRLAFGLHNSYRKNEARLHKLNYIFWECTLRCNLKCIHCGSDCKVDATSKDMPAADFLRAIDEIIPVVDPNNTLIVFTGGEALLRNDLEQVGLELYKRGFPWGIVSNGMALSEKRFNALLNNGLRSITISLDGLEDSHNWMRGKSNSFNMALAAIKRLPTVRDLKYDVVTCANQKNFNELNKIKELLIEMGVAEWRIFTVFPIGRAAQNKDLQLESEQFKALFEFIKQTRSEGKIKLSYGCEGFLGNYEREVRDSFFFCRAGVNIASILADGSISACPSLRSNFIQGNIYKDNFAQVWQNKYQLYRDRSWTKTGECADCEFFKSCEGNGLHLRDENTGELLFCHLKRIIEAE